MERKMTIWRVCSGAALGLLCLIFASRAQAIELFHAIPLPDDGHGSIARGVNGGIIVFLGVRDVVGSKMNSSGMTVPVVWHVNVLIQEAEETELPRPPGHGGEALGGATFPNGDSVVVGNIFSGGIGWGVFWRKPANGTWSPPELLCQDAEQSWVSRAHYCGDAVGLGVAGTDFENGRWRAVLHLVTATDVVTVDLPSPPGSNAAALGLYCEDDIKWVVGRVTDSQGRMRPVLWADSGQGWWTSLIDVPTGVQGQALDVVTIAPGVWKICGEAMRAGRMMGFTATVDGNGQQTSQALLQPIDGYANSTADNLSSSDNGATFGRSTNPGGEPAATGWIGGSPFPTLQLMHDGESLTRNEAFRIEEEGLAVGQGVVTSGGQPQACLFTPTNAHVPDRINLMLGNIIDNDAQPSMLWHEDDQNLGIRAERTGGMLKAVTDLQFTPLAQPSMPSSIQYNLTARSLSIGNTGGGTLNVYGFNFANQTWVPAGSFPLTSVYSGESGALNSPDFVNPQNGAVRLRLEFIANGNQPTALVLDKAQTYMDNPH